MSTVELEKPSGDSQEVVRSLIRHIQNSGLKKGDRLPPIRDLAKQFSCSVSAARDGLMQVQSLGLVKVLPRSGAFVESVDYSPLVRAFSDIIDNTLVRTDAHLFHLLETRRLIEIECATQAASRRRIEDLLPLRSALEQMDAALAQMHTERGEEAREQFVEADIAYHLAISRVAGNPLLETILRSLLGLVRSHLEQIPWTPERKHVTRTAHVELYEAILEGSPEEAGERMRQHLQLAYNGLLKKVWSVSKEAGFSCEKGEANGDGT